MTLHLIKLSVGPESLSDLAQWQQNRLREMKRAKEKTELMHVTRQTPKRAEELLKNGSIYWVIKGVIVARQRLLELRPVTREEVAYCALMLDPELVRVAPRPHRPFQGWRYLNAKDAPADLILDGSDASDEMLRELAALGLL